MGAITEQAAQLVKRQGMMTNPYLERLQNGSMSLEGFRASQEQFFFAVTFFPRPMAALVARIPDPRHRLDILHNLVEEHGEFDEKAFHHNTFQSFLGSIGSRVETLERQPVAPPLRAFNSVLSSACLLDELEVGVACMGIIEYAFAGISAVVGQAVIKRGWVEPEKMVHYNLHAEIDERHAAEFFRVIEPAWAQEDRRYFIQQGLELGIYVFDRLYRDLAEIAGN